MSYNVIKSRSQIRPAFYYMKTMEINFINMDEVEQMRQEGMILIDMRANEDYCKGHLPFAVNIPYEDYESWRKYVSQQLRVILYCSRGNISLYAASKLAARNQEVYTISGGIYEYENGEKEQCLPEIWEVEND